MHVNLRSLRWAAVAVFAFAASELAASDGRLVNISTRAFVGLGDEIAIGGTILSGPKTLLVRGRGPSLGDAGVEGFIAEPALALWSGSTLMELNAGWETHPRAGEIPLALRPGPNEAAILVDVEAGAYTAHLYGRDGGTGVGIVEMFEVGEDDAARLLNISTRAVVGAGDDVLIGGFITAGEQSVVVRARGPSLLLADANLDVLADPLLLVFDANGTLVAANDNWALDAAAGAIPQHLHPTSGAEAALRLELPEGAYTVVVQGAEGSGGVGIVEVFAVGAVEPVDTSLPRMAEGDYWTYAYRHRQSGFGRPTVWTYEFVTLELGPPEEIGGETLHVLRQYKGVVGEVVGEPGSLPHRIVGWTHIGVVGDAIVASRDGQTTEVIWDLSARAVSGGLFGGVTSAAEPASLDGAILNVAENGALRAGSSGSEGGCSSIHIGLNVFTSCDELSVATARGEYLVPGIGVVAYRANGSATSSSGTTDSSTSIDLVASSQSGVDEIRAGKWEPIPAPSVRAERTLKAVAFDNKVHVFDPEAETLAFETLDPATRQWSIGPVVPAVSCRFDFGDSRIGAHNVAVIGDSMLLLCSHSDRVDPAVYRYTPGTGAMTAIGTAPVVSGHTYVDAGVVDGDWYLLRSRGSREGSLYRFNESSGFVELSHVSLPWSGSYTLRVTSGTAWRLEFDGSAAVDLETGTWRTLAAAPVLWPFTTQLETGRYIVFTNTEHLALYDTVHDGWIESSPPLLPRYNEAQVVVGEWLYLIGGTNTPDSAERIRLVDLLPQAAQQ